MEMTLFILAMVAGLYMAWNIGANDVANAMGTSVGSKALTLRQAVIAAAIFEFLGAVFVGSNVANTVRKGIVDTALFSDYRLLMLGMLGALLSAGIWLHLSTMFGLPVSTTHSIVGSVAGFALVQLGMSGLHWGKVWTITASWVISPVLGGAIAFLTFWLILRFILNSRHPRWRSKAVAPFLVGLVVAILALSMVYKGLKNLHLDLNLPHALALAGVAGVLAGLGTLIGIRFMRHGQGGSRFGYAGRMFSVLSIG